MPSPNPPPFFRCPSCKALFQVVKAEAGPETADLEVACSICSGPLVAREGQFVLKYFLESATEHWALFRLMIGSLCMAVAFVARLESRL